MKNNLFNDSEMKKYKSDIAYLTELESNFYQHFHEPMRISRELELMEEKATQFKEFMIKTIV